MNQRTTLVMFMLVAFFAAILVMSANVEVRAASQENLIAQETSVISENDIPNVPNSTPTPDELVAPLETIVADQANTLTATHDPCYIDPDAELIPYCTWTPTPTSTATPTPRPTEETLPKEGLYAYRFEPRSESGDCSDMIGGDNDGPSREYDPLDPMFQTSLCKWEEQRIVLLNNETFRWDGSAYSTGVTIDTFDNSSRSRVISIIDENTFDVILTDQSGACTYTYVIHYELVQEGEMVGCFTLPPTAEGTPEATLVPVETVVPPIVEEGRYVIQWLPYSNHCDTEYAPNFTEVPLSKRGEGTIKLLINGQVVEFSSSYGDGTYSMYEDRMFGNLKRRFAKDFNIELNQSSEDQSKSCYSVGLMTWVSELTAEDITLLGESGSGNGSAGGETAAAGNYSATWTIIEGSCAAELEPFLPDFASATVHTEGETLIMEADGKTYIMEGMQGMYFYFEESGEAEEMLTIYSLEEGQDIVAMYGYIVGEQACYAEVTLKS
jgi:hypothetical protein